MYNTKQKQIFNIEVRVFFELAIIGTYNKKYRCNNKNKQFKRKANRYTETLYNNLTKKIFGHELTFQHLDVQKGYFEVFIDGKLYDTKVFVK